jgi:hypothetical protein
MTSYATASLRQLGTESKNRYYSGYDANLQGSTRIGEAKVLTRQSKEGWQKAFACTKEALIKDRAKLTIPSHCIQGPP